VQNYVANEETWRYTREALRRYFERVGVRPRSEPTPCRRLRSWAGEDRDAPVAVHELIGTYLEAARMLGQRTGRCIWRSLRTGEPGFRSEPYTTLAQRSLYQSLRTISAQTLALLRSAGRA
jgi:maltose alpha-D-glucosyltransferase/alpha-amylase